MAPPTVAPEHAPVDPLRRYRGLQIASILLIVGGLIALLALASALLNAIGGGALPGIGGDAAGTLLVLILASVALWVGLVINAVRAVLVREALAPSRYRGPSVIILLLLATLVSVVASLSVADDLTALQTGGDASALGSMVALTVTQLGLLAVGAVFVAIPRALAGVRLLPGRGLLRSILLGAALSVPAWIAAQVIQVAVVALLSRFGLQPDTGIAERAIASVDPVVLVVALVIVAPIAEEVFFRGIVFNAWEREYGAQRAVYGSALLFAVIHGSIFNLLPIFVLGVLLAAFYRRTRSLPGSMALHAGFNAISVVLGLLVRFDVIRLP